MVVFVCTACGNSVKKNKVEKHYQIECPECNVLSCIDCGKDFTGDEYQAHTSCISEAEKYQGKLFTDSDRAKSSKGERKQQEWLQKLHEVEKVSTDPTLVRYLKMISAYPNVPRKRAKFENFAHNSLKLHNPRILAQLWDAFSNGSPQPPPQQQQQQKQQQNNENVEMEASGRILERTDKNHGSHLSVSKEKADEDGLPPSLKENHKLKKKRKHKEKELEESPPLELDVSEGEPVTKKAKKKKKKKKQSDDELVLVSTVTDNGDDGQDQDEAVSKKRKVTEELNHGDVDLDVDPVCVSKVNGAECEDNPSSKAGKKKKKKKEKVTCVPSTDSTNLIQEVAVGKTDTVVMSTKEDVFEHSIEDVEEISMDTAQSTQQCDSSGGLSEERTVRRKKKKKNKTEITDVVCPDRVLPAGQPLQTGNVVDEMVTAAKMAAEKIAKSSPNVTQSSPPVAQSSPSVAQSIECPPLATFDKVKKKKSKKKKCSKETVIKV